MTLQSGTTLLNGKYRIDAYVGQGASARVYRATHVRLKQVRALKVLRREIATPSAGSGTIGSTEYGEYRQRYQLEAQLGAKVNHDNVIQVFDFEEDNTSGTLILAMEYATGGSLSDRTALWRERGQPMPIEEAVGILQDAASGIAAVHAQDAVHRDLKPSNILLDGNGHAKVADLGLAQIPGGPSMRSQLSTAMPHPGTPAYMSPEQSSASAYLAPASDIYALGLIAFELLTGRAYKNVRPGTRAASLRPDMPSMLDDLVARMLDDDPRKRPFDGAELTAELIRTGIAPQWQFVAPPKAAPPADTVPAATAIVSPPAIPKKTLPTTRIVVAAGLGGLVLAGLIGIALLANSGALRGATSAPTATPSPTHTATPRTTPTVRPTTATATKVPSATPEAPSQQAATPAPQNQQLPSVRLKTGQNFVNVRSGPGTNYAIIGQLDSAAAPVVRGRNAEGTWYQIAFAGAPTGVGWVIGELVDVSGETDGIAVVQAPPSPTVDSVGAAPNPPTPTPEPTTIIVTPDTPTPAINTWQDKLTVCAQSIGPSMGLSITCKKVEVIRIGFGTGFPTTYAVKITLDVRNDGPNSFSVPLPKATDSAGRAYVAMEMNSLWRRDLPSGDRYTGYVTFDLPEELAIASNTLQFNLTFEASGASPVPTRDANADATASASGTSVAVLGPAVFQNILKLDGIQLP